MTNNNTDDTSGTLDQPHDSTHYDNKTIFGHKVTVHGLDNWHQVCFQWCRQQQQQGQPNKCSMYCFKYKGTNGITSKSPSEEPSPTDSTTATAADHVANIKQYMADTLRSYSIVVVKGTDSTTDDYMKAHQHEQLASNQGIHEINVGTKAETLMNNAELLVKKTHNFSKDLVHTWQNNSNHNKWMNGFDYSGTFRTMKDRAVKMMDVARGKYDNDADNLDKKSPNQDANDSKTSDTDTDDDGNSDT